MNVLQNIKQTVLGLLDLKCVMFSHRLALNLNIFTPHWVKNICTLGWVEEYIHSLLEDIPGHI